MAEVRKLAESYNSEEQQLAIFQETFAFIADRLGIDGTKDIIKMLIPSEAGSGDDPGGDPKNTLASGIVRGYLSNARTVLTEEFLDGMCRQALEFGYNLGRHRVP